MADRELLELAANAAGYKFSDLEFAGEHGLQLVGDYRQSNWNPITDGGDVLRLAFACHLKLDFAKREVWYSKAGHWASVGWDGDDYRRAIVRAAAEIGKEMNNG